MDNVESLTIKQRLARYGYEVRRVLRDDGSFRGFAIHDAEGNRVHSAPRASWELGLEIAESLEADTHTAPRA